METHLGALSTVPCGRRNESCDGHILDVDERGGDWVEETMVYEEGMSLMEICCFILEVSLLKNAIKL